MITIPNNRSKVELILTVVVAVLCPVLAVWWGLDIGGATLLLKSVLSGSTAVVAVLLLWLLGKRSIASEGRLQVNPDSLEFCLNGETIPAEQITFYNSNLYSPKVGRFVSFSSQTITIGTETNHFQIGDDIAAKQLTDEQLKAFQTCMNATHLGDIEKTSFNSWVERVKLLRKH